MDKIEDNHNEEAKKILLKTKQFLHNYGDDGHSIYSPLGYAVFVKNYKLTKFILETDPTLISDIALKIIPGNFDHGVYTPLLIAAMNADLQIIKLLIKKDADPLLEKRNDGRNAIHLAAFNFSEDTAALDYLIKKYPKLLEKKDNSGQTPLPATCVINNRNQIWPTSWKRMIYLVKKGANPETRDNQNQMIISEPHLKMLCAEATS